MARKLQPEKLDTLYQSIEQHPGSRPAHLARRLGWHRSEVTRALPALEEHGYLVSEDEKGRLWPFSRQKRR